MIYLFRLFVYSWLSFGRLYISRNLSISSRLSNCLCITNCSNFFWLFLSLWYQLFFHLFYFFLILILFCGWLSSFFLMVSLAKGLSILIIFSKSQLLPSLIFSIIFFLFYLFSLWSLSFPSIFVAVVVLIEWPVGTLLSPTGLMCPLTPLFPYWLSLEVICPFL